MLKTNNEPVLRNAVWERTALMAAPAIEAFSTTRTLHGRTVDDPYAWLRADDWREVLRDPAALASAIRTVLDEENAYAGSFLDAHASRKAALLAEMRGRIREDDASVPLQDGSWFYYQRFSVGGQLPIHCRRQGDRGPEIILVEGDVERRGVAYFSFGSVVHAPGHERIAWSAD